MCRSFSQALCWRGRMSCGKRKKSLCGMLAQVWVLASCVILQSPWKAHTALSRDLAAPCLIQQQRRQRRSPALPMGRTGFAHHGHKKPLERLSAQGARLVNITHRTSSGHSHKSHGDVAALSVRSLPHRGQSCRAAPGIAASGPVTSRVTLQTMT